MNHLWTGLLVISIAVALFSGNLKQITDSVLDGAAGAVSLMIELAGAYCLWMGLEKIADDAGLVEVMTKFLRPLLNPLFPSLKHAPKALGAVAASITSNVLGLSSGTPLGLKAMKEMRALMPEDSDEASDAMITLIVINAAGFSLFPSSVVAVRAALGSGDPAAIAGPVAAAGLVATAVGLLVDRLFRRRHQR